MSIFRVFNEHVLYTFSHDRIRKQDGTLYMIVYFTCHDRILHHPILIKDQIFGSDGFHQHKICVNILVKAASW